MCGSNRDNADEESPVVVTGKREKCAVTCGREERIDVVNGSNAVLGEGTRIPMRTREREAI